MLLFSASGNSCVICQKTIEDETLCVQLRQKGSDGIITASAARGDDIHPEPGEWVHKECRKIYINPQQISKALKESDSVHLRCDSPSLRSGKTPYKSSQQCVFCGQTAKRNGRKRGMDVHDVTELEFQKEIERIGKLRNDEWSKEVVFRIKSVHSDLPAADAVYHQTCSSNFRTLRQIPKTFQTEECSHNKKARGRSLNPTQMSAFLEVAQYLQENDDEQITVLDLVEKMEEKCGELAYSAVHMKTLEIRL